MGVVGEPGNPPLLRVVIGAGEPVDTVRAGGVRRNLDVVGLAEQFRGRCVRRVPPMRKRRSCKCSSL